MSATSNILFSKKVAAAKINIAAFTKSKAAKDALGDVMDQVKEVKGVKVLATSVDGVDMNGLRDLGDQLKEKIGEDNT